MAGKTSAAGKKSGFDYKDGHENKLITTVETSDKNTHVAWEVVSIGDGDTKQVETGEKSSPETSHPDFSEAFQSLSQWVRNWCIPDAGKRCKDIWTDAIHIKKLSFSHNEKSGVTAKIEFDKTDPINGGKREVNTAIKLPALPLFDKEIEGHASNTITTYDAETTAILKKIMDEAKMYLGGKRGTMKGDGGMFSKNEAPAEETEPEVAGAVK